MGEHVEILLPGFLRMSEGPNALPDLYLTWVTVITFKKGSLYAQHPLNQIPQDQYTTKYMNTSWDAAHSMIVYTHRFNTVSRTSMRLLFQVQEAFVSPPNGIMSADLLPRLSCDAYDSRIADAILTVAAMSPFLVQHVISYQPMRAGTIAKLSISVLTRANLEISHTIRLNLKNFTGVLWCWESNEWKSSRCQREFSKDPMRCIGLDESIKIDDSLVPAKDRGCLAKVETVIGSRCCSLWGLCVSQRLYGTNCVQETLEHRCHSDTEALVKPGICLRVGAWGGDHNVLNCGP